MRVIFVCTGNTCRSPMAEAILKRKVGLEELEIYVESRGTDVHVSEPINPKASAALSLVGIRDFFHMSRQICRDDIENADMILTMTQSQKFSLIRAYPGYKYKIFTLSEYAVDSNDDISDPYGKSQVFYNYCVKEIKKLVDALFEVLKEQML